MSTKQQGTDNYSLFLSGRQFCQVFCSTTELLLCVTAEQMTRIISSRFERRNMLSSILLLVFGRG